MNSAAFGTTWPRTSTVCATSFSRSVRQRWTSLDLEPALREHAKYVQQDTGIDISLAVNLPERPSNDMETAIYRIVQETIHLVRGRRDVNHIVVRIRQKGLRDHRHDRRRRPSWGRRMRSARRIASMCRSRSRNSRSSPFANESSSRAVRSRPPVSRPADRRCRSFFLTGVRHESTGTAKSPSGRQGREFPARYSDRTLRGADRLRPHGGISSSNCGGFPARSRPGSTNATSVARSASSIPGRPDKTARCRFLSRSSASCCISAGSRHTARIRRRWTSASLRTGRLSATDGYARCCWPER